MKKEKFSIVRGGGAPISFVLALATICFAIFVLVFVIGNIEVSADEEEPDFYINKAYLSVGNKIPVINKKNYTLKCFIDDQEYSLESYKLKPEHYEKWITVKAYDGDVEVDEDKAYFSKLPVVYITTKDGKQVTSKTEYKSATLTIQDNTKQKKSIYDGKIDIKGRGNSSWGWPKKPYRIKLDKKTDLFGMGKNKNWVLIANYLDECFLRNDTAYKLAKQLGILSMDCVWVDVVFNGDYVGNYLLCEQIRVDEGRVDIFDWESVGKDIVDAITNKEGSFTKDEKKEFEDFIQEDLSWVISGEVTFNEITYVISDYFTEEFYLDLEDISGGYLFELSNEYDEVSKFTISSGLKIMLKSPEFLYTNQEMMDYVQAYWQAFDNAYKSEDGYFNTEGVSKHYSELADLDSMVGYWLALEIMGNDDAVYKSRYAYKDIGDVIRFGPVWDFDWGCASIMVSNSGSGWRLAKNNSSQAFYKEFLDDPLFLSKATEKYWEVRPWLQTLIEENGILENEISYLLESGLADGEVWDRNVTFPDKARGFKTDAEVFKNYMRQRIAWLDQQFALDTTLLESTFVEYSASPYKKADDEISFDLVNAYPDTVTLHAPADACVWEGKELLVRINVFDANTTTLRLYLNGLFYEVLDVVDGVAEILIPSDALTSDVGKKNVISVIGKNADGVTTHRNFTTVIQSSVEGIELPMAEIDSLAGIDELVYDGTSKELVSYNTVSGGAIICFALGNESEPTEVFSTAIPEGVDAGDYYVWYRIVGDADHLDAPSENVVANIGKAVPTVEAPIPIEGLIYSGELQALIGDGSSEDGNLIYALGDGDDVPAEEDFEEALPTAIEAGSYKVWYKVIGDDNHKDSEPDYVTAEIGKTDAIFTAPLAIDGLAYDATSHVLVTDGTVSGGAIRFALVEDGTSDNMNTAPDVSSFDASVPVAVNAGTHRVWFMVVGDDNHKDTEPAYVDVTISRAVATVTATDSSKIYGETDHGFTAEVTGLHGSDSASDLVYTIFRASGESVGTYTILPVGNAVQGNYDVVYTEGTFAINAKTITAPTIVLSSDSFVYDGTEKIPGVTVMDGSTVIDPNEYNVNISNNTVAGTANVTITDQDGGNYIVSGSKEFTISKAIPTILIAPEAGALVYGQSLADSAVTGGAVSVAGTFAWDNAEIVPSVANSGVTEYSVVFTPADTDNYDTVKFGVKVYVAKAEPQYTVPTGITAVYGDTLTNIELPDGWAWADGSVGVGDVGVHSFEAIYTPVDTVNFNSANVMLDVSVAKDVPTLTVPTAKLNLVYNGSAQEIVNSSVVSGGAISFALVSNESSSDMDVIPDDSEFSTSIPTAVSAGNYTVWYKVTGDDNHLDTEPASIDVTISRASAVVYATNSGKVYGDTDPELTGTVSGLKGNDDQSAISYSLIRSAGEDIGTYNIVPMGESVQGNYNVSYVSGVFTIEAMTVVNPEIVLSQTDFVYDGTAKRPSVAVKDGNKVIDTGEYTVSYSDNTNPGTAIVTIIDKDGGNYTVNGSTTFIIDRAGAEFTAPVAKINLVYNGSAQELLTSNTVNGGTVYYAVVSQDYASGAGICAEPVPADSEFSTGVPTGVSAGNYIVWYKVVGDENHLSTDPSALSVTIARAPVTVSVNNCSKAFGDTDPTLSATVSGLKGSDSQDDLSFILFRSAGEAVGTYDIIAMGDAVQGNYNVTFNKGTLTIETKAVSDQVITLAKDSFVYDGTAKTPSVTVRVGNTIIDESEYSVSYSDNVNAGTATVTITDKVGGSYEINGNATFTILKAEAKFDTKPVTKTGLVSDGTEQKLVSAGSATGGVVEYAIGTGDAEPADDAYATVVPKVTDAGEYKVWYRVVGDADHNDIAAAYVTVTISVPEVQDNSGAQTENQNQNQAQNNSNNGNTNYSNGTGNNGNNSTSNYGNGQGSIVVPSGDTTNNGTSTGNVNTGDGKGGDTAGSGDSINYESDNGNKDGKDTGVSNDGNNTGTGDVNNTDNGEGNSTNITSSEDVKTNSSSQKPEDKVALNSGFKVTQTDSKLKISWGIVDGAHGYEVYVAYRGDSYGKPVKTLISPFNNTSISELSGSAIDTKRSYKVYVVAYKMEGDTKVVLAKSIVGYIAGKNSETYTNVTKIKLNKTKVKLKVGEKFTIVATAVLKDSEKKELSISKVKEFRFISSDPSVATVTTAGKIKAKGKGTCYIYVYAKNGKANKVKVTVK